MTPRGTLGFLGVNAMLRFSSIVFILFVVASCVSSSSSEDTISFTAEDAREYAAARTRIREFTPPTSSLNVANNGYPTGLFTTFLFPGSQRVTFWIAREGSTVYVTALNAIGANSAEPTVFEFSDINWDSNATLVVPDYIGWRLIFAPETTWQSADCISGVIFKARPND